MKPASFYEGKPLNGKPIGPVAQGKMGCGPDGKGGDAGAGALHGSEADPWTTCPDLSGAGIAALMKKRTPKFF